MQLASLRAWLKRLPAPSKVVVRQLDGEDVVIQIPADERNRWKTVEASILATGAVAVKLFDKHDVLLRAQDLETEGGEGEDEDPEVSAEKRQSRQYEGMSKMLDAQARALNEAFSKGTEAASQSQDSLVGIVDTLAGHLSVAVTNMHTVVANMATLQQAAADREAKLTVALASGGEGEGGSGIAEKVLGLLAMGAAQQGAANGKPKKAKEE